MNAAHDCALSHDGFKGRHCVQVVRDAGGPASPGHQVCFLGYSTIWVHRNSARILPDSRLVTLASHTCVFFPRCAAVATHSMVPSVAVPRWLDFSSTVVKLAAPSGRFATRP